jgi:pyruvate/2-oxoglutarate dehydrogenase complex dihydrolipoamide acyltransferase (E2) component
LNTGPYAGAVHRTIAVLAAFAVLISAGLTACGSDNSDGSSASANGSTAAAETTAAAPAATTPAPTTPAPATTPTTTTSTPPTAAENAKALASCHKILDPFVVELRAIDKEVAAGPHYKRYSTIVNKFVNSHGQINAATIPSASCETEVDKPISDARWFHGITVLLWTKCRKAGDCSRFTPGFKKRWRQAERRAKAAAKGFKNVTAGS